MIVVETWNMCIFTDTLNTIEDFLVLPRYDYRQSAHKILASTPLFNFNPTMDKQLHPS